MEYVRNPQRFGRYIKSPRAIYYYINKALRNPSIRRCCFKLVRSLLPKMPASTAVPEDFAQLVSKGIVFWPECIDQATLERIRHYLSDKRVVDVRDTSLTPIDIAAAKADTTRKLKYLAADLAASDDILRIANDDKILSLVSAYFGCKPTITIMDAWWTKTGPYDTDALFQDDMYHRDVEDFKFLKFFIYLTDVAPENGAHCFVRGSQLSKQFTARGPIADSAVKAVFAPADQLVLTGKAGCGFLEDTWGLHRSLPAKLGERLLLSITYSLTSFNPQSPDKPVAPQRLGVDPYINRVYLQQA